MQTWCNAIPSVLFKSDSLHQVKNNSVDLPAEENNDETPLVTFYIPFEFSQLSFSWALQQSTHYTVNHLILIVLALGLSTFNR